MSTVRTKVDRLALIERLNAALVTNAAQKKENERKNEAANKLRLAHNKSLLKSLKAADIIEITLHKSNWRGNNSELRLQIPWDADIEEFEIPEDLATVTILSSWQVKEIEQAIKVLEMSTEPSISMAALKDVAQYL